MKKIKNSRIIFYRQKVGTDKGEADRVQKREKKKKVKKKKKRSFYSS